MATKLTPVEMAEFDQSRQHTIVGCLVLFMVLGNASVAGKLCAQFPTIKKLLVEDYFLISALAFANAVCASYLKAVHHGLGLHFDRVVSEDHDIPHGLIPLFYWLWLPSVFNGPVFGSIKFALLFLYRRLFLVNQKWLRIVWWANVVYLVLWFFGSFFYYLFACTPPSYYWNRLYIEFHKTPPFPVHGTCVRSTVGENSLTLDFAVIQDAMLLLIPIITLSRLKLAWRRKLALVALFALGSIACVLEVARIIDLSIKSGEHGYAKLTDPTWDLCDFIIMTCAVEMIGIMCACLPTISPRALQGAEYLWSTLSQSELSGAIRHVLRRSSISHDFTPANSDLVPDMSSKRESSDGSYHPHTHDV